MPAQSVGTHLNCFSFKESSSACINFKTSTKEQNYKSPVEKDNRDLETNTREGLGTVRVNHALTACFHNLTFTSSVAVENNDQAGELQHILSKLDRPKALSHTDCNVRVHKPIEAMSYTMHVVYVVEKNEPLPNGC